MYSSVIAYIAIIVVDGAVEQKIVLLPFWDIQYRPDKIAAEQREAVPSSRTYAPQAVRTKKSDRDNHQTIPDGLSTPFRGSFGCALPLHSFLIIATAGVDGPPSILQR
jgi:hypothetical protein